MGQRGAVGRRIHAKATAVCAEQIHARPVATVRKSISGRTRSGVDLANVADCFLFCCRAFVAGNSTKL